MTQKEAENYVVKEGTCAGWSMATVLERRPASLRFYLTGYTGKDNVLRAAATILSQQKRPDKVSYTYRDKPALGGLIDGTGFFRLALKTSCICLTCVFAGRAATACIPTVLLWGYAGARCALISQKNVWRCNYCCESGGMPLVVRKIARYKQFRSVS